MAYTSPKQFTKPGKYRIFVDIGYDSQNTRKTKSKQVYATSQRDLKKKTLEYELEVLNKYPGEIDYENITVMELYEEWMSEVVEKEKAIKTRDNYQRHFSKLLPKFGKKKISELRKATINNVFKQWEKEEEKSLHDRFYALRALITYAVRLDIIPYHIMDGLTPPKKSKANVSFYDEKELLLLSTALEKDEIFLPKYKLMVKLAVAGGMRHSEIKGITLDSINYTQGYIHINKQLLYDRKTKQFVFTRTKNKEDRKVYFTKKLMDEVREHHKLQMKIKKDMGNLWKGFFTEDKEEVMLLFSNPDGTPNDSSVLNKVWKKFQRRHDLREIRFHDLRHSCATFMLNNGENFKTIAERLGHRNVQETMNTYTHATEEKQKAAASYFDNVL